MSTPAKIKVEKGIDLPRHRNGPSTQLMHYPFFQMEIGDSFLVPGTKGRPSPHIPVGELSPEGRKARRADGAVSWAAAKFRRRHKEYRFAFRVTPEGVRCWRVEAKPEQDQ